MMKTTPKKSFKDHVCYVRKGSLDGGIYKHLVFIDWESQRFGRRSTTGYYHHRRV